MPNHLSWCDLPTNISLWPKFPLSLSGDQVIPLDYHAGRTGWLLYGRKLDKPLLTRFQFQLGMPLVMVSTWCVDEYQVIHMAAVLTARTTQLAHEQGLDVAPLNNLPHLKTPGLLVLDMDSTAIQIECIDEIAKLAGSGPQVADITERAMRGELDFATSLHQRVATLKDADARILQQVCDTLPLMPGLITLVKKIQALGWQVALISGGFSYYAEYLRQKLHLTAAVANQLEVRDGKLTGKILGNIVDGHYKAQTLRGLAEKYQIAPEQTVAVGDGANDLAMMAVSALGIAYQAKPKVNEKANVTIRHADLMGVFCILSGSLIHEAYNAGK